MEDYIEIFDNEIKALKENINTVYEEISMIKKIFFEILKDKAKSDANIKKDRNHTYLSGIRSLSNEEKRKTKEILGLINKLEKEVALAREKKKFY